MTTASLVSPPISNFEFLASFIGKRTGIVLEPEKAYLVDARLAPIARQANFASIDAMVGALRLGSSPQLERAVLDAMTTNETSFFRDAHPFEALRLEILPDLVEQRAKQRALSIWSAACSTGQEAYTISMILREHFPQLSTWNLQILGTDICHQVLERAREAKYNQTEMNRGLPATLLVKYFERQGIHWSVRPELKSMVRFQELNLIEKFPPLPQFDVIFLRNVLIYFSMETKRAILTRLHSQLRPDGYLVLGGAETTCGLDQLFKRVSLKQSYVFRKASLPS
ncbi:MCP methyltransferase, CheR-type [Pirellula staleyi DSM 6068]|uniref:protein-glutamate O-methyltransferase n=1 Tax=Pirellula staleyi (strain ATCC 27377 / DSM 6068 / ICPB 4128) TaxID=530564 RepID=D2QXT2_PIRSD|nr:protein-glutamate O-methyltransferase CheR [Pirellula staleyi]ADB18009.1 MCP methyltransferase, CheR-type [Pirellula staleyi DSM 6068]